MSTEGFLSLLDEAWGASRAAGVIGGDPIEKLRDHAAGFIPAAFRVDSPTDCLDVGTGAGLPGLLLAHLLPSSSWTLLDSNERRCDLARRAVESCGLSNRVEVIHSEASEFGSHGSGRRGFDFVVSRLFGGFSETAECCLPMLRTGGSFVVSSARDTLPRWESADLTRLGGEMVKSWVLHEAAYVQVLGVDGLEDRFPRRSSARRRRPFEG